MVSRQETARPLLTPGEMQLPPEDAVVMVSSVAPIKAKKLRYYADANFKNRVLPPPVLAAGRYADAPPARPDDWSGLAIPAVPTAPASVSADGRAAPMTAARAASRTLRNRRLRARAGRVCERPGAAR
jgi:type IV secretion system protein VirD4